MAKVSVVISAFNAQGSLDRSLKSVRWASEIILVDNGSTDNTVQQAKKYGAKIFSRENNPMLNVNKNFGFEKAEGDWILSLDSDEEVPRTLASEIEGAINDPSVVGYWIPRKNIIFGKWIRHGLWWPDKQLRLFHRGRGKFPCKHVHEYLDVDGPTGELQEPYIHYNYTSVSQFIHKMDAIYTESEVQKLTRTGYQVSWMDAVRFPVSDFVKIFFAQRGFKDGLHGLVLALLQSFYSFIVFAKLWERAKFVDIELSLPQVTRELHERGREVRYWTKTAEIEQERNPITRGWKRLVRKLYAS
ncbi:glycosyltransferase family 2 protein [Candidatus Gottesmanbacteria bacterium]|nr:glycosyltransferase family 2 protein [Candidatus Gottesmanbacteria bacterium]